MIDPSTVYKYKYTVFQLNDDEPFESKLRYHYYIGVM